jgi:hypothetical protein
MAKRFEKNITVTNWDELENNPELQNAGDIIIIVNSGVDFGESESGKSLIVAKTDGYKPLCNWLPKFKMNLHIFRT